jgi:hypothetical protein
MNSSASPPSRRQVLRALGACVPLPLLGLSQIGAARATAAQPRRIVFCYVPNGKNIFDWKPKDRGAAYHLSPTLQVLAPHRKHVSVLSGLGHPRAKGGHSGADTWLTGADLGAVSGAEYTNTVSIDQVIAEANAPFTRFASLQLSDRSGTGVPGHTATLSFDHAGTPLPAEDSPRRLFDRLFVPAHADDLAAARRSTAQRRSILDSVAADAVALARRLDAADRRKLDEYLGSVRATEKQVQRSEAWLDRPKAKIDPHKLELAMQPGNAHDRPAWIDVMLDLTKLAFATDTTRVVTFEWSCEASGFGGSGENHHELSHHGGDPGMLRRLAEIDRFHVGRLKRFLDTLDGTPELDGTLLDRTLVVYGSGMNSGTRGEHSAEDLPLLVAGGRKLGFQHGRHIAFAPKRHPPLSSLWLALARSLGVTRREFADSRGPLKELI